MTFFWDRKCRLFTTLFRMSSFQDAGIVAEQHWSTWAENGTATWASLKMPKVYNLYESISGWKNRVPHVITSRLTIQGSIIFFFTQLKVSSFHPCIPHHRWCAYLFVKMLGAHLSIEIWNTIYDYASPFKFSLQNGRTWVVYKRVFIWAPAKTSDTLELLHQDIDTWYHHETLKNDRGDTKNDDSWYTCSPDFIANLKPSGTMRDTQKTMTISATSFRGCNRFSPLLIC